MRPFANVVLGVIALVLKLVSGQAWQLLRESPLPLSIASATCSEFINNKLYVVGEPGTIEPENEDSSAHYLFIFDQKTQKWSEQYKEWATNENAQIFSTKEYVYVYQTKDDEDGTKPILWTYDISTEKWSESPVRNVKPDTAPQHASAAVFPPDTALICGGYHPNCYSFDLDIGESEPNHVSFDHGATLPSDVVNRPCMGVEGDEVYMVSGEGNLMNWDGEEKEWTVTDKKVMEPVTESAGVVAGGYLWCISGSAKQRLTRQITLVSLSSGDTIQGPWLPDARNRGCASVHGSHVYFVGGAGEPEINTGSIKGTNKVYKIDVDAAIDRAKKHGSGKTDGEKKSDDKSAQASALDDQDRFVNDKSDKATENSLWAEEASSPIGIESASCAIHGHILYVLATSREHTTDKLKTPVSASNLLLSFNFKTGVWDYEDKEWETQRGATLIGTDWGLIAHQGPEDGDKNPTYRVYSDGEWSDPKTLPHAKNGHTIPFLHAATTSPDNNTAVLCGGTAGGGAITTCFDYKLPKSPDDNVSLKSAWAMPKKGQDLCMGTGPGGGITAVGGNGAVYLAGSDGDDLSEWKQVGDEVEVLSGWQGLGAGGYLWCFGGYNERQELPSNLVMLIDEATGEQSVGPTLQQTTVKGCAVQRGGHVWLVSASEGPDATSGQNTHSTHLFRVSIEAGIHHAQTYDASTNTADPVPDDIEQDYNFEKSYTEIYDKSHLIFDEVGGKKQGAKTGVIILSVFLAVVVLAALGIAYSIRKDSVAASRWFRFEDSKPTEATVEMQ